MNLDEKKIVRVALKAALWSLFIVVILIATIVIARGCMTPPPLP